MADTGGVRITGLNEVLRDFQDFGVSIDDLKAAFARIADKGAQSAARHAPVKSGALRASIRGSRAKNAARIRAGTAVKVPYAGAINYGWRKRNIKPQLFMQAADREVSPTAWQEVENELNHLIGRYF
jgi:hypothetical protein